MFPWADASSASLTRSSMKFALSVFMLFLTALFASVYSSCAVAFIVLVRLLLIASFFSFLAFCWKCLQKSSLLLVFLLSQNFAACACPHLLDLLPLCVYVHVSFLRRSCRASYLFLTVSRKVSVVTLSFRKSTLYCVLVLLLTSLFFSFIFILSSTRWWSEAASAPLCSLTSCIDLLNFRPMQIWSIWFSVLWSGYTQVALWIHPSSRTKIIYTYLQAQPKMYIKGRICPRHMLCSLEY